MHSSRRSLKRRLGRSRRGSRRERRFRCLAALILAACQLGVSGCGIIALTHDKMLGPISPAGEIHPVVVGENFRVGDEGPLADAAVSNPFRPFPSSPIRRLSRFVPLARGLQFAVASFRMVLQRSGEVGRALPEAELANVRRWQTTRRVTVNEVLEELGPPRVWIRRPAGSIMTYAAESRDELSIRIGPPAFISAIVPVPGISNASFEYTSDEVARHNAILFFDGDGHLVELVEGAAREP